MDGAPGSFSPCQHPRLVLNGCNGRVVSFDSDIRSLLWRVEHESPGRGAGEEGSGLQTMVLGSSYTRRGEHQGGDDIQREAFPISTLWAHS